MFFSIFGGFLEKFNLVHFSVFFWGVSKQCTKSLGTLSGAAHGCNFHPGVFRRALPRRSRRAGMDEKYMQDRPMSSSWIECEDGELLMILTTRHFVFPNLPIPKLALFTPLGFREGRIFNKTHGASKKGDAI